ncbi:MAG: hypothetical protein JWQ43_1653 [Glaciihabitans sp.]|nr:hypothetical protein [Glaciihabitans sp.]
MLHAAWDVEAVTASELMVASGLSRSTVIGLCDELVTLGWFVEIDGVKSSAEYRKGRPARTYAFHHRAGHVVGVDAGQHHLTAVVTDLAGTVLGSSSRFVDPKTLDDRSRTAAVAAAMGEATRNAGMDAHPPLVTVIAVPAPTDSAGESPAEEHSDFWARMNPGFARHFSADKRVVIVENDANLAAIAEAAHQQRPASFVTLLAGERLGAGFLLDGHLVRGNRGAAGELRFLELVEGVGSSDGLAFMLKQWARAAREAGTLPKSSSLSDVARQDLDAARILAAADAGDLFALGLVDRLADRLARICLVLSGILDVDKIIIAGALAPSISLLVDRTAPRLAALAHRAAPEVVASALGDSVVATGAIEHALAEVKEHALELRPVGTRAAAAESTPTR